MIDIDTLTNVVVDTHWDKLVRLPFANRALFNFPSSPYGASGLEDGPEANAPTGLLPIKEPAESYDVIDVVTSTTHAATELTEYGVPGATGEDVMVQAEPGVISAVIPIGVTGFALDRLRTGDDKVNFIIKKMNGAFKQLGDYINAQLLGTGVKGIVGAWDDTVAYAGLDPATYTLWSAYTNATGGYLSSSIMDDVWFTITGGDRQAREEDIVILMPSNQLKRYKSIGDTLAVNGEMTKGSTPGGAFDIGHSGFTFNGRPIIRIPDMTTTVVIFHNTAEAHIQEVRPLQITMKPYAGDGELLYATWRGKLMIPNRHQGGKAEGLTA